MLNVYFAFGVPAFLVLLYGGFAWYRQHSTMDYLGFVLFIIAGFLTIFSFQVIQQAFSEITDSSYQNVEKIYGYPLFLLGIPILLGVLLLVINSYRGYLRLKKFRLKTK